MIKAIKKLETLNYIKSNRFIIPLIIYIGYLEIAYHSGPIDLISSYVLQGIVLFCLMTFVAVTFCDSEHEEIQQIMLLKLGHEKRAWLYICKIVILCEWTGILALIATAYPMLKYMSAPIFLKKIPTTNDVIFGFFAIFLFGFIGCLVGLILNNRTVGDRKLQICLLVLAVIVSITGNKIGEEIPIFQYIIYIVPPLGKISKSINKSACNVWIEIKSLLICCAYSLCYIGIYIILMVKPMKKNNIIHANRTN